MEWLYRQISMQKPVFKNKSNSKHVSSNDVESLVGDGIIYDTSVNREEISESEVDLSDISKAINCGLSLDLKDFSDQFVDENLLMKKVPVESPFVQVI